MNLSGHQLASPAARPGIKIITIIITGMTIGKSVTAKFFNPKNFIVLKGLANHGIMEYGAMFSN
jgi:hypothetical protein